MSIVIKQSQPARILWISNVSIGVVCLFTLLCVGRLYGDSGDLVKMSALSFAYASLRALSIICPIALMVSLVAAWKKKLGSRSVSVLLVSAASNGATLVGFYLLKNAP